MNVGYSLRHICRADVEPTILIRWFVAVRPQSSRLPTINPAPTTSPMHGNAEHLV